MRNERERAWENCLHTARDTRLGGVLYLGKSSRPFRNARASDVMRVFGGREKRACYDGS